MVSPYNTQNETQLNDSFNRNFDAKRPSQTGFRMPYLSLSH